MNRRQKIIVSVTGIFLVALILMGLTYAYFLTRINGNPNETSVSVTTADLKLTYNDGSDGVIGGQKLIPSDTEYTKTFTVKNEGNVNITYAVFLINVVNTFERKDDIKYKLNCITDGTYQCLVLGTNTFPSGTSLLNAVIIEPNKTHTYTFTFTYKDSGTDQSVDMNKELSAKIQIFTPGPDGAYIPFEDGTLAYNVINNVKNGNLEGKTTHTILNSSNMVDTYTEISDKILSEAQDNYSSSYYFRGNPIDNYVEFADMCWRIVRIQGDGSTKLLLASELSCSEANLTNDSGFITDGNRGVKGNIINAHYGYKIQNGYLIHDYINSPEENSTSARVQLNNWLDRKITEAEQELLKNEPWCIGDLTNGYNSDKSGKIVGNVDELIASGTEFLYTTANKSLVTKTPSYVCQTTGKTGEIDINKVGMLTYDEVTYASGGMPHPAAKSYLSKEGTGVWATLSPYATDFGTLSQNDKGTTSAVLSDGLPYAITFSYGKVYLRASVVLKPGVHISDGIGTINDPYVIE